MADLALVIVNFNAGEELRRALQSIADDWQGRDWEAVVVDNASDDGSGAIAKAFSPRARLLRNDVNAGFGRGVNQGVAASDAPLILIMNPDCRLAPGATASLIKELQDDPACAMVGPKILDPDGTVQGSARGDPDMLTGLFGRTTWLRRLFPSVAVARRNVVTPEAVGGARSVAVDWLSGACVLVRRDRFEAVGGFDERFFLYWEDADLCRRLRGRGNAVRYVPGATAVHQVGHSSRRVREAAIRAFHQSAYLYYATHVAPHPWQPTRLAARVLLTLRCWVQLRVARASTRT